ncbi:hypothetical protein F5I97DRAFT_1964421 [Phlebopus sp. FC_14]|nr:hypothetical protein F5I97DRAFT_1964421 [Phlebopus sp. FC_14]
MPPAIDDITHPSSTVHTWQAHHHKPQHRVRRIPCGRCDAVIEHGSRAHWSTVSRLVNSHWEACPGRPHVAVMPRCVSPLPLVPLPPRSTTASPLLVVPLVSWDGGAGVGAAPVQPWTVVLPPTHSPYPADMASQSITASPTEEPVQRQANATQAWMIPSGWERKRKTENQRRLELESDEYTANVTATSVTCIGCRKEISLDKRSRYYPGLWTKHRSKCPDIERLERTKHGRNGSLLNEQMRRPVAEMLDVGGVATASSLQANDTRLLIDIVDGNGHYREPEEHGASRLNRAEQSRERRLDTAAVHQGRSYPLQQTASSSSSDLSSEDEYDEDDGVNLLHVPFPTLNQTFYHCNKSEEWSYRYATDDEILTNFYAA